MVLMSSKLKILQNLVCIIETNESRTFCLINDNIFLATYKLENLESCGQSEFCEGPFYFSSRVFQQVIQIAHARNKFLCL